MPVVLRAEGSLAELARQHGFVQKGDSQVKNALARPGAHVDHGVNTLAQDNERLKSLSGKKVLSLRTANAPGTRCHPAALQGSADFRPLSWDRRRRVGRHQAN